MGWGKPGKLEVQEPQWEDNRQSSFSSTVPKGARLKQASFGNANIRDIHEDYAFGKQLGTGHFGTVKIAKYIHGKNSTKEFAVKTINKGLVGSGGELEYLKREVDILLALDHPNIVKLFEVYEDAKYLHLVMEYWSGGELFNRIIEKGVYSEKEAAQVMRQVLHSVSFMHQNGIAHRDLKPENFLFESDSEDSELKLIDFGLSQKFSLSGNQAAKMTTIVGSPYYVAPEVLRGQYGPECDIWSCGVLLYILLSGRFPFEGQSNTEIFKAVMSGYVDTSTGIWKHVSTLAKDLVKSMIIKEPSLRIKADRALQHRWFDNQTTTALSVDAAIITQLRKYKATSTMQKEAMNVMVKYLEVEEITELRKMFNQLDHKRTGTITAEELETALTSAGYQTTKDELHQIIGNIDYLGNGEINYSEFLAATITTKIEITSEHLWSVFKRFDTDDSGFISEANLAEVMTKAGKSYSTEEILKMIKEVDLMNDNQISFDEFKKLMIPKVNS